MEEKVYLKDIAGYDEEKEEAKKIIEVLKNHNKYGQMGAYIPKGLILSGNPGVGKTLLAKAIANESGAKMFEFETNESETESETIKSIKELFVKAKENAPAIIFIDELDELVMTREFISDYSRKVAKILLTEIDGISSSQGVIVIATTNHRSKLPPALLRSGRMDKRISIEMPDDYSREEIFKYYLNKHESLKHINANELAKKTCRFSGADIKTLINETIIDCGSKNKNPITMEDFEKNISVVLFQNIKKTNKNSISETVCYHEIGHFIVEYIISGKIGAISAESYGEVRGHVKFDYEDSYKQDIVSRNTLKNKLTTLLGGMAGEDVLLGDITTGSAEDVATARNYIRSLMAVGAFGFGKLSPEIQLGRMSMMSVSSSNQRLLKVEDLEHTLLDEAFNNAKAIIQENKEMAKVLFEELKKKERLSSKEISQLLSSLKNDRKDQ